MSKPLTLLIVNGHPDDETVTAGGVMARYASAGTRVVCVIATRGELGQIVDPALDTPENRARIGELREQEMRRALQHLGPIEARFLDFRDSGMMGSAANEDPRSFWKAPLSEATRRLVRVIRETRPQVVIGPNAYGGDGHPDHIRAHEIAVEAYLTAGDPAAYPAQLEEEGLEPWSPLKLYEPVNQFGRREKLRRALRGGGIGSLPSIALRVARLWSPGRERQRRQMAAAQAQPTTRVDVTPFVEARLAAMTEYRTQIAPGADVFALSPDERRRVTPTEDFTLRLHRLDVELPEDDLFAGVTDHPNSEEPNPDLRRLRSSRPPEQIALAEGDAEAP